MVTEVQLLEETQERLRKTKAYYTHRSHIREAHREGSGWSGGRKPGHGKAEGRACTGVSTGMAGQGTSLGLASLSNFCGMVPSAWHQALG